MDKAELERLKDKVPCAAVLERAGFALDIKQSTRKAMKYRRDAAIIIVIHDGKGWFDPLGDDKGDVFRLVEHLEGVPFVEAMNDVACLVGFVPSGPVRQRESRDREPDLSISERWQARRKPWRGSATWCYLTEARHLPEHIIRVAVAASVLCEGPHGSMWAAHVDAGGALTGWEERGPEWRGFATGGAKVLFRLGRPGALRLCVTEAAIDAMSLAALESFRADTLYLSTGGGWSPATDAALRALVARLSVRLVAATDNNRQGDIYAGRLLALAGAAGCGCERLRPVADDWNADLKTRIGEGGEGEKTEGRMPAVRLKGEASPGSRRPLTRPGGEAAAGEGSRRAEEDGDP
ncbi:DUF3991 and toprim domain-containing protein [Mesorhizobium sp. BH1-1-5]|uniref:DUF3991 and toprim domain-containing protein n=2 Tax=unclassified Mesorhizobium TaxID=325217 RepID=UPI00112C7277|nr:MULTISPECIES: DUF3991 and toprim domain-containing protein [unclassified Mesorhizobium]MBZ9988151.1 DUF3991 and toprim domain-containing protein [Mesorhizobium sp. BH1-1-5]TPJ74641.1 DUF3991 domain-containing protein [Mesorhizobium sp. B2-7-1]